MPEKKYAISNTYGYGEIRHDLRYHFDDHFVENATLPDDREIIIEPAFAPIQLQKNSYGKPEKQPLLLICEDGKWFEFFSHTPVNVISKSEFWEIYRTTDFTAVVDWDYSMTDFASRISSYSDAEIENMVNQFLNLIKNAQLWGKGYIEAQQKKARKEKNEIERMDALSGKYQHLQRGDEPSGDYYEEHRRQEAERRRQDAERKRREAEQKKQEAEKLRKADWILKGKCAFCGGEFKGFFSKNCSKCGRQKNY